MRVYQAVHIPADPETQHVYAAPVLFLKPKEARRMALHLAAGRPPEAAGRFGVISYEVEFSQVAGGN